MLASTRNEWRREKGTDEREQYLTVNHLELKLHPDYTLLGKYRYSLTRDLDLDAVEARFDERSLGVAYRPVQHDQLNLLARYTGISDQRPLNLAGVDAAMPAAFATLHSKYRTPHVALIVQAIATTALLTPGPRIAATPTASRSPGMLKKTSITRLMALSHVPPA